MDNNTRFTERSNRAYDVAAKLYKSVTESIHMKELDVGEGIAVCYMLASWLKGSADAQSALSRREFVDVPYYGDEEEQHE